LSFNSFSQISFEKGYFISNSNKKVECLIRNMDWKNNPTEFEYKLSDIDDPTKASIESVIEFGVYNSSKFIKVNVKMDRSSEKIPNMDFDRNPTFQDEVIFLKSLIEGKANLYSYEDGNLIRFFFSKDDSNIEQLVFKRYLNSEKDIIRNDKYRQQLLNELKCDAVTINDIKKTDYKKSDLIKLFIKYNNCNNSDFKNFSKEESKKSFDINIKVGLNNSSITSNNINSTSDDFEFDEKLVPKLGFETEFYFPFNNNKWSMIMGLSYQNYKSNSERTVFPNTAFEFKENAKVNYKSVELPIGFRHYLFLNNNSKIFLDVSYIFDFNKNSEINIDGGTNVSIDSKNNISVGFGYKFIDKYSIDFKYQTERKTSGVSTNSTLWFCNYNSVSISLGYTIF
jgi:hypothetical protein